MSNMILNVFKSRLLSPAIREGKPSLILTSPEGISQPPWNDVLSTRRKHICAVIVDEAHLLLDWKDFRPKYKDLTNLPAFVGSDIPWALVTATASKTLVPQLLQSVNIKKENVTMVASSPDRY